MKIFFSLPALSEILALIEIGGRYTEFNRVMASSPECINFIFINNSKTNNDLLCLKGVMAQFIIFKYLNSFGLNRCEVLFLILKCIS